MKTFTTIRTASALFAAGLMICGGAAVASAAETTVGDDDVNVDVSIAPVTEPGVLTMSVATNSTALTENTPGGVAYRQFEGTLPTVTVTDTRASEEIPAGASWYVLGSASEFTATGLPSIPGANLGWTPATVGTVPDSVFAGEPVAGALDGSGPGLTDRELLFTSADSTGGAPGSWSANAALRLRTAVDVTPGDYTSTVTVTLFENSL